MRCGSSLQKNILIIFVARTVEIYFITILLEVVGKKIDIIAIMSNVQISISRLKTRGKTMTCTRPGCKLEMKLIKDEKLIKIYECKCGWKRTEEKG